MKLKQSSPVVLSFNGRGGEFHQHCMTAFQAWLLAQDLRGLVPTIEIHAVDSFGRRLSSKAITFDDIDFTK